jgi:hypothetical protein
MRRDELVASRLRCPGGECRPWRARNVWDVTSSFPPLECRLSGAGTHSMYHKFYNSRAIWIDMPKLNRAKWSVWELDSAELGCR